MMYILRARSMISRQWDMVAGFTTHGRALDYIRACRDPEQMFGEQHFINSTLLYNYFGGNWGDVGDLNIQPAMDIEIIPIPEGEWLNQFLGISIDPIAHPPHQMDAMRYANQSIMSEYTNLRVSPGSIAAWNSGYQNFPVIVPKTVITEEDMGFDD